MIKCLKTLISMVWPSYLFKRKRKQYRMISSLELVKAVREQNADCS